MNCQIFSLFPVGQRWKRIVCFAIAAWVPATPGRVLRRLLYQGIFERMGQGVRIKPFVEFHAPQQMRLGNHTTIESYARLRVFQAGGRIIIDDHAYLDKGVDLKLHGPGQGRIRIGHHAVIGAYTSLSGASIRIGAHCLLASHVGIYANNHIYDAPQLPIAAQGHRFEGIVIEEDCWLGTGVKVLDGVTIGRGSVIGAGAVVTKDIPPYSVAVGVPARVVSRREGGRSSRKDWRSPSPSRPVREEGRPTAAMDSSC